MEKVAAFIEVVQRRPAVTGRDGWEYPAMRVRTGVNVAHIVLFVPEVGEGETGAILEIDSTVDVEGAWEMHTVENVHEIAHLIRQVSCVEIAGGIPRPLIDRPEDVCRRSDDHHRPG